MKTSVYLLVLAAIVSSPAGGPLALAQELTGRISDDVENGMHPESRLASSALPVGQLPRYRVPFMKSNTVVTALRTATVISITNQSSLNCSTAVDFRVGSSTVCTTIVTVAPGATVDHCSRPLPSGITSCNATCSPALTAHEGNALVTSSAILGCDNIAVSARTYYTGSSTDSPVSAVTNAKIVGFTAANLGD